MSGFGASTARKAYAVEGAGPGAAATTIPAAAAEGAFGRGHCGGGNLEVCATFQPVIEFTGHEGP